MLILLIQKWLTTLVLRFSNFACPPGLMGYAEAVTGMIFFKDIVETDYVLQHASCFNLRED